MPLRAYRALRTLGFHRRALGVVLRERPALVQCNDFNTMWIGVLAKLLTGSRVVYDSHELWPDRNGRWEWRPGLLAAEALFVRVADRVVTVSPEIADAMASRYRIAPPDVVRNVPAAGLNGSRPATAEPPVAVYVGALLPGRGLEQAIDAAALVPGLRLRIIGPDGGRCWSACARGRGRLGSRTGSRSRAASSPTRSSERWPARRSASTCSSPSAAATS